MSLFADRQAQAAINPVEKNIFLKEDLTYI